MILKASQSRKWYMKLLCYASAVCKGATIYSSVCFVYMQWCVGVELWEDKEKQKDRGKDPVDSIYLASLWILDSESYTGLVHASRQSLMHWKDEKLSNKSMSAMRRTRYTRSEVSAAKILVDHLNFYLLNRASCYANIEWIVNLLQLSHCPHLTPISHSNSSRYCMLGKVYFPSFWWCNAHKNQSKNGWATLQRIKQ